MKENILIFGSSGHAKVIISIIEMENKFNIIGIVDPNKSTSDKVSKYNVLGGEDKLNSICEKHHVIKGIIAIGDNLLRKRIYDMIISFKHDFKFVSAIHPSAQIASNVIIGNGTVIMPGAIINSASQIGNFAIVNTNASLDHDCILGNYCSLAPGVVTGGFVNIGDYSSISIGAVIKNNINIGEKTIVGAGSLVLQDLEDNIVAYGIPAKKIRQNIAY